MRAALAGSARSQYAAPSVSGSRETLCSAGLRATSHRSSYTSSPNNIGHNTPATTASTSPSPPQRTSALALATGALPDLSPTAACADSVATLACVLTRRTPGNPRARYCEQREIGTAHLAHGMNVTASASELYVFPNDAW